MWIVKIALDRPYTFIVLALLILILSPVVILGDADGHLSEHQYSRHRGGMASILTGLSPEQMEGRVTTVYERVLTTTVDNIEHIESTTINGVSIVKVFLQPKASIDRGECPDYRLCRS